MSNPGTRSHPSHDHKSYAILVREDLLADLAHLDPRLVTLLAKGYSLARELGPDPGQTYPEPELGWGKLVLYLDQQLRLSRSKLGFRSNQLTSSLTGPDEDRDPSARVARKYESDEKSMWK